MGFYVSLRLPRPLALYAGATLNQPGRQRPGLLLRASGGDANLRQWSVTGDTSTSPFATNSVIKSQDASVATLTCKQHDEALYVLAVGMRNRAAKATIELQRTDASGTVQVLGENRTLKMRNGRFEDESDGYAVHLYRLALRD